MKTIKEFIEARMALEGLSQSEVARRIGVRPNRVHNWLNGVNPDPPACGLIAKAFGVPKRLVMELAGHFDETDEETVELSPTAVEVGRRFDRLSTFYQGMLDRLMGEFSNLEQQKKLVESLNNAAKDGLGNDGVTRIPATEGGPDRGVTVNSPPGRSTDHLRQVVAAY